MTSSTPPSNVITLGGKGSSLTSSSLFLVANHLAEVKLDSSLIDKLSSSSSPLIQNPNLSKHTISFPEFVTLEEKRASLVLILNKLLLSVPSIRIQLVNSIVETLNLGAEGELEVDMTDEEKGVIDVCLGTIDGICGILDHGALALAAVVDAAAALSCEALRAIVAAFGGLDSGDGFSATCVVRQFSL